MARCETCERWQRRRWPKDVGYCDYWGVLRLDENHCAHYTPAEGDDYESLDAKNDDWE